MGQGVRIFEPVQEEVRLGHCLYLSPVFGWGKEVSPDPVWAFACPNCCDFRLDWVDEEGVPGKTLVADP